MPSKKTARRNKKVSIKSRGGLLNKKRLVFIGLFAVVGVYMLVLSFAQSPNSHEHIDKPFVEVPERGLHWAGLHANAHSALCGGDLLEVIDATGNAKACTHGPDPAPDDVNVNESAAPLSTGESLGSYALSGSVSCDGDGTSGDRIQAIYVHATDKPDRFDTYAASFQQWAANVNAVFNDSAAQTGGARLLRWVNDSSCNIVVNRAVVSAAGDDTFSNMVTELSSQGYNRTDRKYLLWSDANVYCGIGGIYPDDTSGSGNRNNFGPSFARVDSGCWGSGYPVEAHEIMHNLGGVQNSAPHTTHGWHCTDEYDRMCYADAAGVTMTYACTNTALERLFDCNHDDYFSTSTTAGTYLAGHWNTANNLFLISPGGTPIPPTPTPSDTTPPTVRITSPLPNTVVSRKVNISASSTDSVGVVKLEVYIDGFVKATTSSSSISTTWSITKNTSKGAHIILVKAYDAAGNVGQSSVSVIK